MSLFAELKRRNAFRVEAAFVIFGWLPPLIRGDMARRRVRAKDMESSGEIPVPTGVSG